jgi:hypothetical protein
MAKLLRILPLVVLAGVALAAARGATPQARAGESARPVRAEAPEIGATPPRLLPTGGPYVETGRIIDLALSQSDSRGVQDARVQDVLFMKYADAVRRTGCGWVTAMSPDREVYLVSIKGAVAFSRHGRAARSFSRSVCIFDASTGRLVVWGATNRPEPEDRGGAVPAIR